MDPNPTIIFVCEHGAAKSIIAATYFNKLAVKAGLTIRAIARGTDPDPKLSSGAIAGLQKDGLIPAETIPRRLTLADVQTTERVFAFCELPEELENKTIVEKWDDIPPVSENYEAARDAILTKLNSLLK